jgi:type I restriction enzyme S subunit
MELNSGYKQSDVGAIPIEWEVKRISDIASVGSGGTPSRGIAAYWGGSIPWVTTSQIDFGVITQAEQFITEDGLNNSAAKVLPAGTLLMALYGQGKTRGKVGVLGIPASTNQACASIQLQKGVSQEFILLYLASRYEEIRNSSNSGSQENLNGNIVKQIPIAFPPANEQHSIAVALSDVDAMLNTLDRLIAKKRDLKQAAMQQLLTGKTRLSGFSGEWEVKQLKSVAEISTGINKPLSEMGSGTLYVTVQDLYDKTSIRTERLSRIKVTQNEIDTRCLVVGDIVFGKSSVKRDGIGFPSQFLGCNEAVIFSGFTYRARARNGITDPTFLFYALREDGTRRWLIDNSQASALTNINQSIADAIPVQLPPTINEQIAIGSVLMKIEGELTALEQRRNKTAAIKQGMMQELLTGRTRLV